jgi:predicted nucleic acid-binding protein
MYLLGEAGGWRAQGMLWSILQQGDLEIAVQSSDDYERMRVLMQKYRDLPMDLADASLVRLAEERRARDIFTLDERDFRIYRIHGRQSFRLWPGK